MGMIYLIRHGQASFLKENYDELSDLGKTQALLLGEELKKRKASFSKAMSGSLQRHKQTCENASLNLTSSEDKRWNEYDHMELLRKSNPGITDHASIGDLIQNEVNPMYALQQLLNQSIEDWIDNKHEYTQTWKTFKEGVWAALNDLAVSLGRGENAIVFTSGGPISVVLIQLLELSEKQFIPLQGRLVNTGITKVLVGKSGLSLSTYNDYGHLEHDPHLITYR